MIGILIVDDSLFARRNLEKMIPEENYSILGDARSGKIGIQKYKELNPDLVFLDITMPDLDGLAVLKEILVYNKEANVVMCSALGQKPYIKECLEIGALDFLPKPFEEEDIIEFLEDFKEEYNK